MSRSSPSPGVLTAALNWYRAMSPDAMRRAAAPVSVPTTYVWGSEDIAFGRAAAERTGNYVDADYRFVAARGRQPLAAGRGSRDTVAEADRRAGAGRCGELERHVAGRSARRQPARVAAGEGGGLGAAARRPSLARMFDTCTLTVFSLM